MANRSAKYMREPTDRLSRFGEKFGSGSCYRRSEVGSPLKHFEVVSRAFDVIEERQLNASPIGEVAEVG